MYLRMSRHKYLCIKCRYAAKIDPNESEGARCPTCRGPLTHFGVKLPLPRKDNIKAWEALGRGERLLGKGKRSRSAKVPFEKPGICKRCGHPIGYHHLDGGRCSCKDCTCPGYQ
jgi:hypothetical protein